MPDTYKRPIEVHFPFKILECIPMLNLPPLFVTQYLQWCLLRIYTTKEA